MKKEKAFEEKEKIRKTGIDIIDEVPWGTHLCQFYQSKEDLIDVLVPYFKAGLENNEFCMWVTSEPLSGEEAKKAMKKAVPNFDQYLKRGQIEIIPHAKWYLKSGSFNLQIVLNGWIDKLNKALANGYDGIRITGNTAWFEKRDWRNFTEYEATINKTISEHRMIAICTYSLDKCGASEVIDVVNNHQYAIIRQRGKWELMESSARKKTEEALGDSKERLKEAQALGRIGSWEFDIEKQTIVWSNETYVLYERDAKFGPPSPEEEAHYYSPEQAKLLKDYAAKAIKTGQEFSYDLEAIMPSGKIVYFHAGMRPIKDACGRVVKLFGIVHDITERKKAEEKIKILSNAVENAYDAIIVTDLNGKIEYVNKAVERIYGYKKSELVDRNLGVLDIDPKMMGKIISRGLKAGWSGQLLCKTKKGKQFPILLSVSPIKNEDGKTVAIMGASKDLSETRKLEKEKKILTETVVKLTKQIPLTKKEKLVFYGLVKWPELNDLQLSKQLKVKRSTVTAIKNKLKRKGFYSTYVIPNFGALGYELMSVIWGESSLQMPLEEKTKINPINKVIALPESVYGIATDKEFMGLLVLKNFTEFKKINDSFSSVYRNYPVKEENINIAHFPFETSKIYALFDYDLTLGNLLDLNLGKKVKNSEFGKVKQIKLTEREAIILYALTKYPELNDTVIAKKVKTARQTVSKIKHRLMSQGIIKLINEPNIKKIGCELFAATYNKLNAGTNSKETKKAINAIKEAYPTVFRISSNADEFCLTIFKDYTEYKARQNEMIQHFREKNMLSEELKTFIIPIKQIKFYKMDFASLVKKTFDLKIDF